MACSWSPAADLSSMGTTASMYACMCLLGTVDVASEMRLKRCAPSQPHEGADGGVRVRVRVEIDQPGVARSPAADLSSTGTTPPLYACMCLLGSVDVASADAGCG